MLVNGAKAGRVTTDEQQNLRQALEATTTETKWAVFHSFVWLI